jgi:FkbM family methyltransferase
MKYYIPILFQKLGFKIISSPNSGFEYLLQKKRYQKLSVNLADVPFEIADSTSFYWSHREIFVDEIYKFRCDKDCPNIIDCGSNYGTSIVYFKQLYPNAKINGIEADPNIFEILDKNINERNYKNVNLLNKAISNENGLIHFFSEGADGGRTYKMDAPRQTDEVETIDIDELINGEVDFLKMDIEGAETDVLCKSQKLGQVNQMFIEYHSFADEKQKLAELLSCLSKNNFRYYIHTQFCSKKPLIENETQLGMDLQLNIFANRN